MAFVIKNSSRYVGEVQINGEWVIVHPGESVTSKVKPPPLSPNLKVYFVDDTKVNAQRSTHKKDQKGKNQDKTSDKGVASDASVPSSPIS